MESQYVADLSFAFSTLRPVLWLFVLSVCCRGSDVFSYTVRRATRLAVRFASPKALRRPLRHMQTRIATWTVRSAATATLLLETCLDALAVATTCLCIYDLIKKRRRFLFQEACHFLTDEDAIYMRICGIYGVCVVVYCTFHDVCIPGLGLPAAKRGGRVGRWARALLIWELTARRMTLLLPAAVSEAYDFCFVRLLLRAEAEARFNRDSFVVPRLIASLISLEVALRSVRSDGCRSGDVVGGAAFAAAFFGWRTLRCSVQLTHLLARLWVGQGLSWWRHGRSIGWWLAGEAEA